MYPTTTIIIQNAVASHHLGIATGTLNFFRQLGGAIIVAVFSAIVLGGVEGGVAARALGEASRGASAAEFAVRFRFVFIAAAVMLAISLAALLAIEERPLRGPVPPTAAPRPRSPGSSAPEAAE
jgi:hypothetical protein